MRRAALLLALLAAAALPGCGAGGTDGGSPESEATLLLDFAPNAVHAGIYLARERGYDDSEGVELEVRPPGTSTDATKLLAGNRVDYAILDIHDLALARQEGAELTAVMAIVQTPLASILAQPEVRRPRDLEGRRVGVTGLPSDDAVLASIVRGDGGDPERVRRTTIGFNAVAALLARRVAGATAFWNAEGVAVAERRPGMREFRVDRFGAPQYPELVLAVTRTRFEEEPSEVKAVVRALRRGYEAAIDDPPAALSALTGAEPDLDAERARAEFDAVAPSFTQGAPRFGAFDPDKLDAWARWERAFGITDREPDVGQMFSVAASRTNLRD